MTRVRPWWLVAAAVWLLPLFSVWTSSGVPLLTQLAPALLLAVAAAAPLAALSALALLGPVAVPLRVWLGSPPIGGNEMLELIVLPVLAGLCLRRAWRPGPPAGLPGLAAWVYGSLVMASAAVLMAVQPEVFAATDGGVRVIWTHLTREYFAGAQALPAWHHAAMWLEGLCLAALIAGELRVRPAAGPLLARLALAGLAVQAAFSWDRLVQIALRDTDPAATLLRHLVSTRISPHMPDLNAMGSVFALATAGWAAWRLAPGLSRRWRMAATAGTALAASALWMTHSRSALAATALVSAIAWLRLRRPSPRLVLAVGLAALLVTAALATWVLRVSQAPAGTAAHIRVELALAGVRMAAAHPWFGVGLGQFQPQSLAYTPSELRDIFPQSRQGENAHNQFAQVLGELGLTGLAAFCAYWLALFWPVASRARDWPITPALAACVAALSAFLLSAMLGHPFLTPAVTLTTFFVVGVTAGLIPARQVRDRHRRLAVVCVLVIAVSVPFRVAAARRAVDLDNVVMGASPVAGEYDGVRYRVAEAHSVWLVRADARVVDIPLRADAGGACTVFLAVDGHDADLVQVSDDRWTRVRFTFQEPETRWRTRRVDIRTSDTPDTPGTPCTLLVGRPVVLG